jgi:hypothetical protein
MIGRLVGDGWEAVLADGMIWESADRRIAMRLNRDYPRERYWGPSKGTPGFKQLNAAAEGTGAEIRDQRPPAKTPEGVAN